MTKITEGTPVLAPLTPGQDTSNIWPTHSAEYGRGGLKLAMNKADRDAIAISRRYQSLVLVLKGDDKYPHAYYWSGMKEDGTDGAWVETYLPGGFILADTDGGLPQLIHTLVLGPDFEVQAAGDTGGGALVQLTDKVKQELAQKAAESAQPFTTGPYLELADRGKGQPKELDVKPGSFELRKSPGYLAYMQYPEFVYGKMKEGGAYRKGTIWPEMVRVSPEGLLQIDRNNKAIGLQETDAKDPNITGGSKFLVWPFIYCEGVAPDDGYIELIWYKRSDGSIATDMDGHPLAVRHNYKQGDVLTPLHAPLMFAQVMSAKGLTEYQLAVVDNFDEYVKVLDYSEGPSGLCIQELSKDGTASEALLCAEVDTGFSVRMESYYLGTYLNSIGYLTGIAEPAQTIKAGSKAHTVAGIEMYAVTDIEYAVNQGMIQVSDVNGGIADFYLGLELSSEQGRMIAGKDLQANLALIDKNDGWNIGFFTYSGDVNNRPPIYKSRNNMSLVLEKGWAEWHTGFISEDVVSGLHSAAERATVPKNADSVMVAIYPVQAQSPMNLNLKGFHLDSVTPEEVFSVNEIKIHGLQHLDFMTKTVKMVQGLSTKGADGKVYNKFAGLRYTDGPGTGNGIPMPLGVPTSALEYLTLDKSLNTISGSSADGGEGALVASERVEVTIWQTWQLYNELSASHEAIYWLMVYKDGNGQTAEVPHSRTTFTVDSKRQGVDYFTTNKVTVTLEPGDYIYVKCSSEVSDGAYAKTAQASKPLLITYVQEKYLG